MNKIFFDYHELPGAYLSDNPKSDKLREQLEKISSPFFTNHSNQDELKKQLITNQVGSCPNLSLDNIFFSNENINIINNKLIFIVYKISKIKIVKQSIEALLIVMRYVYINYAKHLPFNINGQVSELNKLVLKEILPNLMTNINQKLDYLEYINKRPQLLDLPQSTNKTKTLVPFLK